MTTSTIELATPDGPCTTEVVTPDGAGPWPAVIVFFDAGGLRPAQTRIAERIARDGYVVLQPDLFHRAPPLTEPVVATRSARSMKPSAATGSLFASALVAR